MGKKKWFTTDTSPVEGRFVLVRGGRYDTNCQMDGFEVDDYGEVCLYNPKCSPPWVVVEDCGECVRIRNPTHWQYTTHWRTKADRSIPQPEEDK